MTKETANKILNELGTIPLIEIIQILNGLRLSCRISATLSKEQPIKEMIEDLELYYIRSSYSISNTDNFSHNKSFQLQSNDLHNKFYYYIGVNEAVINLAYLLEGSNTYRQGILFGYPDCCIKFFHSKYKHSLNDLTYEVNRSSNNYIFWNNRISKCMGYCLISHFPCSWDCMAAQVIAKQTYNHVFAIIPDIANKCLNLQKQNIFYSTEHIIFSDQHLSIKLNSAGGPFINTIDEENNFIHVNNNVYSNRLGKLVLKKNYIYLPFNV